MKHLTSQAPDDKELRKGIHHEVKKNFPMLETKTVTEDNKTYIKALWQHGESLTPYGLVGISVD